MSWAQVRVVMGISLSSGTSGALVLVVLALCAGNAEGDTKDEGVSLAADTSALPDSDFHARAGVGVTPVAFRGTEDLPRAHHGVGAFVAAFGELPYRLSLGAGFDWERYSYETTTTEARFDDQPVFPDETLTHTRLLGLFEWAVLERGLVNPYFLAAAGWGWEQASKPDWQCTPETLSGPVFGGGVGVDITAVPWLTLGVEYRITTLPIAHGSACTMAYMPDEPLGPPRGFTPQRIALTLGVNDAF